MKAKTHSVWFIQTANLLARDYERLGYRVRVWVKPFGKGYEIEAWA